MKWIYKKDEELADEGCGFIQESEDGKWELFVTTTIFGHRVVVRRKGAAYYEKEICGGSIPEAIGLLYLFMLKHLSKDGDMEELISQIPVPEQKPYYTNTEYLTKFFALFDDWGKIDVADVITQDGLKEMRRRAMSKLTESNE